MWNSMRSVRLSVFCTRIVMVLVVLCAIFLPHILAAYSDYLMVPRSLNQLRQLTAVLYACCVPALTALFLLDRMLSNIKKGEVFVGNNVKMLRAVSWCCFAAAAILLWGAKYYFFSIVLAIVLGFIGLLCRVVKNVIAEAVNIKQEHDYTI